MEKVKYVIRENNSEMLCITTPTSPNRYLCGKQKGVVLYKALNLGDIYVVYIHLLSS